MISEDAEVDIATSVKEMRSKEGMEELARWVDGDEDRFALAWDVMQNGAERDSECASWMVDKCLVAWPDLLAPYQFTAFEMLRMDYHQAVLRCLTKNLTSLTLDDDLQMPMFEYCLEKIGSDRAPVAIRCHCIFLAWSIVEPYPDLHEELALTIETGWPTSTSGFRNRGKKILEKIRRQR